MSLFATPRKNVGRAVRRRRILRACGRRRQRSGRSLQSDEPSDEEERVLKIGYGLLMAAGACAVGFVGYHILRILIAAPGIHPFFKVVILLAAVGAILVLVGLVRERRKEERDAPIDDGSD
jgi:hypothetical protein